MKNNSLNFLFYLDPYVELGKPDFRLGALKNQFGPLARMFDEHGCSIDVVANSFVCEQAASSKMLVDSATYHHPTDSDLYSMASSYKSFSKKFSQAVIASDSDLDSVKAVFARMLGDKVFDVVIIWESASSFMRHLFPDALILNLTPGIFSRSPMPDMVSIDVLGFFSESVLGSGNFPKLVDTVEQSDVSFVSAVASKYFDGILSANAPITRSDLDPEGKYEKLVLVPLQVSNYFAFNDVCEYENQFEFMIDVLRHTPSNVGVVVTQYVSAFVSDMPINDLNYGYLKQKYPNLIFDNRFNTIDSISQSLLPFVDAVVTVSSSIGLQAALCHKPVMSPSSSHVTAFNVNTNLRAFFESTDYWGRSTADSQRIVAMLLKHMHFVKADTLFNPQWMIPAVEAALLSKRSGGSVVRTQLCFSASDDAYRSLFLSERSREDSYLGVLERSGMNVRSIVSASRKAMLDKVVDKKIQMVSFDIFDTLVQRTLDRPVDVFTLMEPFIYRMTSGKIQNFSKTRYLAEKMARTKKTYADPKSNEVLLSEIYDIFVNSGDMSQEQAVLAMNEEMRMERKVLIRKEDGISLLRAAKTAGKRVLLISDMYLPKSFLISVLDGLGIRGYGAFYISCEHNVRKHDGRLFDVVAQSEGVVADASWLHIGDNMVSDIDMAMSRGLSALKLVRGSENLMRTKKYSDMYLKSRGERTIWDSIQLGLIAKEFHADTAGKVYLDTHFSGSPYQLGYAGIGPLLTGFALWLANKSRNDGVSDLYFLARDGDVMKRVFDVIAPSVCPEIKTHYIYSSRRAAQVAGIDSAEAIMRMCGTQFHGADLGTFLYEKFGLSASAINKDVIQKHGYALSTRIVKQDLMGPVLQLCLDLRDAIFAQSKFERDNYLAYLRANGVDDASKIGLVDIGYAGSMQQSLSQMLGRTGIHGYYCISFSKAASVQAFGNPVDAYFGNFIEKLSSKHPIASLGLCFEMLFTNCDGSFVRFDVDGVSGRVKPVFDNGAIELNRRTLLPVVKSGAVAYASDMTRYFSEHFDAIAFDPQSTLRVFVDFLEHPGGRDAGMLEGWKFEDSFSGVGVRYAIPTREEISRNPKVVDRAVWKQGAQVFARRADIFGTVESKPLAIDLTQIERKVSFSDRRTGLFRGLYFAVARFILSGKKFRKFERDPVVFWLDSPIARVRILRSIIFAFSSQPSGAKG